MKEKANKQNLRSTWSTIVHDKLEPCILHHHPGDALGRQVRVDRGELATDGVELDDLPDRCSYPLHCRNERVWECPFNGKLALHNAHI